MERGEKTGHQTRVYERTQRLQVRFRVGQMPTVGQAVELGNQAV